VVNRVFRVAALGLASSACPQLLDDGFGTPTIGAGGATIGGSAGMGTAGSGRPPETAGGSAGVGAGGTSSTGGRAGAGGADATGGSSASGSGGSAGSAGSAAIAGGTGGSGGATTCSLGPFSTPEVITGLGRSGALYGPSLSRNGRVLAFSESIDDAPEDIFFAQRDDRDSPFGAAVPATGVNTTDAEGTSFLSDDVLTLYFFSDRDDGAGGRDIYRATRSSPLGDFDDVNPIEGINGAANDHMPWLSPDELSLYFSSARDGDEGDNNLWYAERTDIQYAFDAPRELADVNSSDGDASPTLTADQLILFFCTDRDGGPGSEDIWMATRADITSPFGAPEPVPIINESTSELNVTLSGDGREVVFSSNRQGGRKLFRSVRSCL
jgi:hypothetical protein